MIRLLDVDNRMVIPYQVSTQALVTTADVIHAWTVPSLGVKVDACPGRLNSVTILRHRPGIFFGQCSEIWGANHRFIPITLELITKRDFIKWIIEMIK